MAAEIRGVLIFEAPQRPRFNEAAANGRGNRTQDGRDSARQRAASMRPRRMAAEISGAWFFLLAA